MKTKILVALAVLAATSAGCDEHKYDAILAEAAASAMPLPVATTPPSATASAAPAPTFKKRNAADCKPHTVDFAGDAAFEAEVRRKLGKDGGAIAPADL